MKRILFYLYNKLNKLLFTPVFQEENIHISWSDFLDKSKLPQIVLYTIKDCSLCEEIELWLSNNWIPFKKVKCSVMFPTTRPKDRILNRTLGFTAKLNTDKKQLFLHNMFPQVDLVSKDGVWVRHIANTKIIRQEVEKFILKNVEYYVGFESGIYGDILPENNVSDQMNDILKGINKDG